MDARDPAARRRGRATRATRRRLDARQLLGALDDLLVEPPSLRPGVAQQVDAQRRRYQVVDVEAGIDRLRAVRRLRTNRPAAINSSSDSATSATTSTFLRLKRRPLSPPALPVVLSAGTRPGREAASAGSEAEDETGQRSRGRARTAARRRSMAKSSAQRQRAGRRRRRRERLQQEPRERHAGDARRCSDSSTLSVSSCCTGARGSRRAPAGAPARAAVAAARDSSRLATLAQAISRIARDHAAEERRHRRAAAAAGPGVPVVHRQYA